VQHQGFGLWWENMLASHAVAHMMLYGCGAGINAARRAQQLTPIVMPRNSSYLGTLVDDLVTKVSNQAGNLCLQI
jgi:hypothetical protein